MTSRKSKGNKYSGYIPIIAAVLIISGLAGAYFGLFGTTLKLGSITPAPTCDFTVIGVSDIKTISNEPTLNNEKIYLVTVRADKGGECIKATVTQDDLNRMGIPDTLLGNLTLSVELQDMSLQYKLYNDVVMYKVYESTATADLSQPVPYSKATKLTTRASALGTYVDPNGQAPKMNHLGNFPSGGDVNLMVDIGRWAYVMPEASNIPFGADKSGNWWVTHFGGVPYYRGYLIDTMPFNKYQVQFTLSRDDEILAQTTMDEQNRVSNLGDFARIKAIGGRIESVFPPQPGVDFAVVQGVEGTPVKDQLKFVTKPRYSNYKTTLDELVNFDNNYFVYSWANLAGSLVINSTPVGATIYIDNRAAGITPVTIPDVTVGRHTITAKTTGFRDFVQEINTMPTINKVAINMALLPPPVPPAPLPPAAPVARDPGVGRETITDKENTLNNMLGLMSTETTTPRDCVLDVPSLSVVCRPTYPVTYPEFQLLIKAKTIAMQIDAGIPKILSVDGGTSTEGVTSYEIVKFKNIGKVPDSFDISLQSKPSLSSGVQTFTLPANGESTATIPFSGAAGNYSAKIVMQSKNNPLSKTSMPVNINISKNTLPSEIEKLQKQTGLLEDLIGSGYAWVINALIALLVVGIVGAGYYIYLKRR
ncbi:MAG: PEGA domain-containing protein [Candidatus Ratteibacteria bacterium]|nr:PEGA domain-containing protein [Candidatus Ratteibacteria bacterium]